MRLHMLARAVCAHPAEFGRQPSGYLLHHLAAISFTLAALLIRWLLDPVLGDLQPLSLLFGAVALSVWIGGYKPALTATMLGYLGADHLFTEPRGVIAIETAQQLISLITYLLSSAIIIAFGEALRRSSAQSARYAQQLEQHKIELEDAHQAKDEFLATLAHELRNPLAAVTNIAQVLTLRAATYPSIGEACKILDRQTAHVTRLVDDLLDISRIRSGRVHLSKERLQIREIIAVAVDAIRPAAQAAGHSLEVVEEDEQLTVYGDFARLTQVVSNLLSNAVRYTPPAGSIRVTLRRERGTAVITVQDTGIGIPPHMLENIFNMFEQADTAMGQSRSGLGIGLALVRKLLALHDAEVKAFSEGVGMGSKFTVRLPLLEAPDVPRRDKAATAAQPDGARSHMPR
jgi:signal transduction histidine kinase